MPTHPEIGQFEPPAVLGTLGERGWLASQPPAFQAWIAANGQGRNYSAGRILYAAGDEPDGLYGLGEGALEITLPLVSDEPVTIHRAEPGYWIGESALLARTSRLVSLAAATDVRVFRVPAARVRSLVAGQPEHWGSFFELSHINVTLAVTLRAEVLALSPRARLARMLLRLADAEGRVVVRQDELARLIGMTRSSLQRAMRGLTEAGAVASGYGSVVVRDRGALEAISGEA
jgi:CRP-like cAMP-binding protein